MAAGCTGPSAVRLCGGVIENSAGRPLEQVRVEHRPTNRVIATSPLLPGRAFQLGFAERDLLAESAVLTWIDPILGPRQAAVALPRTAPSAGPHELVYTVTAGGSVTVSLRPCRR